MAHDETPNRQKVDPWFRGIKNGAADVDLDVALVGICFPAARPDHCGVSVHATEAEFGRSPSGLQLSEQSRLAPMRARWFARTWLPSRGGCGYRTRQRGIRGN
jgi:hypothetical protein